MNTTLKKLLKEYNISQRQIAEQMGISPQALGQRLQAEELSLSTLQGIAKTINISLATLIEQLQQTSFPQIDELSMLRRENELLKQIISEKDKIIDLLQQMRKSGE